MSKVSIVVPIYNVEDYLGDCLESLINQTYKDIEILCINDGSKDNSLNVALEYEKKDSRIKVFTKENGGLSDARNYGIPKTTGEYLLLVDSDDYIALDTVEKCLNKATCEDSDIVVFDMKYVYTFSNKEEFASGGDFTKTSFKENRDIIFINNSACNKMYKKELFDDVEFPKGMLYEDLATIPILLSKAKVISKLNEPLYYYVQRKDSIAHTIDDRVFDVYKAIKRVSDYYDDDSLENEINSLYIKHGLYLTTLRIKDNSDDIVSYFKKNNECLDLYYPRWRKIKCFYGYNIKCNLIFKLLQKNKFSLVKKIYKR